jgi:hypothetical protein
VGEASHLLTDGDHRDADHHDEQRGDVVATCEVVERLLEEEQTPPMSATASISKK